MENMSAEYRILEGANHRYYPCAVAARFADMSGNGCASRAAAIAVAEARCAEAGEICEIVE